MSFCPVENSCCEDCRGCPVKLEERVLRICKFCGDRFYDDEINDDERICPTCGRRVTAK